jgi:hypothetical protein
MYKYTSIKERSFSASVWNYAYFKTQMRILKSCKILNILTVLFIIGTEEKRSVFVERVSKNSFFSFSPRQRNFKCIIIESKSLPFIKFSNMPFSIRIRRTDSIHNTTMYSSLPTRLLTVLKVRLHSKFLDVRILKPSFSLVANDYIETAS